MSLKSWLSSVCKTRHNHSSKDSRKRRARLSRRRTFFETLENRRLLATFAESGPLLNLDLNVVNQSVSVVSAGTSYNLALNSGTWSGTDSANVTGNGTNLLTVTTAGLAAFDTINITDSAAGAGVTFANSGANAYSDNLNVTLDSGPTTAVVFNGSSSFTASNSINVSTTRDISLQSGSSVATVNGNLDLKANWTTTTAGNFVGIDVNNATVQATGTGIVTVQGKGGDNIADGVGSHIGVRVLAGGKISGGTSGLLTVQGIGGNATGGSNHGVDVTGLSSTITSSGGNVSVTGTGGTSNNSLNVGVRVSAANGITAGGSGTVTVMGQGGTGTGNNNNGVWVVSGGSITSGGGNVSVTGTGGGSGGSSSNQGVLIQLGGVITAGGTGTITVVGQGGNLAATGGFDNQGVYVLGSGSVITSGGGNVSVTGTGGGAGTATQNNGVFVNVGQITAGSGGTVTVVGQGGNVTGNGHQPWRPSFREFDHEFDHLGRRQRVGDRHRGRRG